MVMWFGFDWPSKAAVVAVMCFFPMLVNTLAGLGAAGSDRARPDALLRRRPRQTLLKLYLPAAMPFIFNALKINSTLALDRRDRRGILRHAAARHRLSHFHRSRPACRSTWCGRKSRWPPLPAWPSTGSSRSPSARRPFGIRPIGPELGSCNRLERTTMMKKLAIGNDAGMRPRFRRRSANAADKVTIQLKWVTQAQFAGYYVAKAKGFYKDAGLDVTINPGGPDVAPPQVIAGGGADVVVDWMPSALASREKGVPLVNISQTFKTSGLELTCRKDTGIKTPADLQGQDARRLVRRQRISVPAMDGEARAQDRRLAGRRQGDQAGLQRRSAVAEAGRLHLDHDLQRILASDRRRL